MSTFQCATAPNTLFNTREELHEHYKSEWHRYNLRRRAAGLAPIPKDVFDKVRAMAASQEKTLSEKSKKKDHVASKNRKEEEGEEEEEEDDQEPLEERVKKAIEEFKPDPCRCLFDDQTVFGSVEENLDHMHSAHGFLVRDLDACKDVQGLINYLAEKIQVGRICLNCEKEFRSAQACVTHMEAKGHCNVPWEFEDEIEEFLEYYDFSSTEEEKKANGTMEYDSGTGELILRDAEGKTTKRLGPSKAFREIYKSVHTTTSSSNLAMSNAVKERSLQLYRRTGVSTSTALSVDVKKRLFKKANAEQARFERRFQKVTYNDGMKISLLIKDRKAGTNIGAGHGVHG